VSVAALRFSLKFQKIVEQEQGANFISRLHGGKLEIIPWPVIESKEFYKLFSTLEKCLDLQKFSHMSAGEFLHTIKTLMAKLKANFPHFVVNLVMTTSDRPMIGDRYLVSFHITVSWSLFILPDRDHDPTSCQNTVNPSSDRAGHGVLRYRTRFRTPQGSIIQQSELR
jgi:hypothetical protein